MANKRDQMSGFISDKLRELLGQETFIQLAFMERTSVKNFYLLQKSLLENKAKVLIKEIKPVVGQNLTPFMYVNPVLEKGDDKLNTDKTGIFEIHFDDGQIMMIGTYFDFRNDIVSVVGGTPEVWWYFKKSERETKLKQEKPKPGIYNVLLQNYSYKGMSKNVIVYKNTDWVFTSTPIHPKIKVIEDEIEYFFNNLDKFSRYGQIPFRKLITIGPPGTGKTTINFHVSRKLKKNYSIIFSQNMDAIAAHMQLCAKHDVPTIVFYDDAEHMLGSSDSTFLNFLSGSNTPAMKKGCMIVFTSNLTDYIEPRILQRPGRIDRIIEIDPLKGKDLFDCAKMYFEGVDWSEKTDAEWIELFQKTDPKSKVESGLTGAEIQGLAQYCYQKANSEERVLNFNLIQETKEQMAKELNTAYIMMEGNSMVKRSRKGTDPGKGIGFKNDSAF